MKKKIKEALKIILKGIGYIVAGVLFCVIYMALILIFMNLAY